MTVSSDFIRIIYLKSFKNKIYKENKGPLKFTIKVAWIKSPDISKDISFNSIASIKKFTKEFGDKIDNSIVTSDLRYPVYNIDYDIIYLFDKSGKKNLYPVSENPYLAKVSETLNSPIFTETDFKNQIAGQRQEIDDNLAGRPIKLRPGEIIVNGNGGPPK